MFLTVLVFSFISFFTLHRHSRLRKRPRHHFYYCNGTTKKIASFFTKNKLQEYAKSCLTFSTIKRLLLCLSVLQFRKASLECDGFGEKRSFFSFSFSHTHFCAVSDFQKIPLPLSLTSFQKRDCVAFLACSLYCALYCV